MKISFEVGKLDLLKEINSTRHEIGGDQGDLNQVWMYTISFFISLK